MDNDVETEVSEENIRKMTLKRGKQMEIFFDTFIKKVPRDLLKQVEKRKNLRTRTQNPDSESSDDVAVRT